MDSEPSVASDPVVKSDESVTEDSVTSDESVDPSEVDSKVLLSVNSVLASTVDDSTPSLEETVEPESVVDPRSVVASVAPELSELDSVASVEVDTSVEPVNAETELNDLSNDIFTMSPGIIFHSKIVYVLGVNAAVDFEVVSSAEVVDSAKKRFLSSYLEQPENIIKDFTFGYKNLPVDRSEAVVSSPVVNVEPEKVLFILL